MDFEHHRNCIALLTNALVKRAGLEKEIHVSGNESSLARTVDVYASFFMDVDVNNFLVKTRIVPIDDFISTVHSFTEDLRGKKQDFMEGSLDRTWEKFNSGKLGRKEKLFSQAGALFAEFLVNLGVRWAKLSPLFGHKDFNKISKQLINAQIDSMTDKHGSFVSWPQLEEYWQKLRDCEFDNQQVEKLLKYIAEQSVVRVRELKG